MNKTYLKENGLYDAHKQFMRLCEWSYSPTTLEEDDMAQDNNQDQNGGQGEQPPMGGGADPMGGGQPPMGGDADPMGGGQGGQDPMASGADPMGGQGGDMSGGTDPMGGAGQDPMGGDADPMGGLDPMGGDTEGGEDEEVIDVEDLTDAQEKVNDKVNHIGKNLGGVDKSITKLMATINKMETMIKNNNEKIEALNKEFMQRVKTPTEKLNLRSLDSYPFNVSPKDYWEKTAQENPQYSVADDNSIPTSKEYTIRQSDLDNVNSKDIEDSFFIDDMMRQDINKIFGL